MKRLGRGRVACLVGGLLIVLASQFPGRAAAADREEVDRVHEKASGAVRISAMMAELTCDELLRGGEDELLTVELRVGRHTADEAFTALRPAPDPQAPATSGAPRLCLPLGALARKLEFAITVDTGADSAEGWFIEKSRRLELDVAGGTVEVGERRLELSEDAICRQDDDIYVDMGVLEDWFPITAEFDFRRQVLELSATEPLPFQERLERARLREMRLRAKRQFSDGPAYRVERAPYALIDWPVHDIRLRGTLRDATQQAGGANSPSAAALDGSYTLKGAGDILFMGGRWTVTGSRRTPVSQVRLTLERKDPGGELGGELGLTHVAAGDVVSSGRALMARGSGGRGVYASNVPIVRSRQFDKTSLHGELDEGWQVELYRGRALIDFQSAPVDGRYHFDQVPLLFGENEFRLVFHGPYGQTRTERRTILVGPDMIKPGESHYTLYAAQQGVDAVEFTPHPRQPNSRQPRDGKLRAVGEFDFGLSHTLSFNSSIATIPGNDRQRSYAEIGVTGSLLDSVSSLSVAHQFGDGFAGRLAMQGRWGWLNFAGEHIQTMGAYHSETFSSAVNALQSHSELTLNSTLKLPGKFHLPMRLVAQYDRRRVGGARAQLSHNVSARLWGIYTTHNLRWRTIADDDHRVASRLQAHLKSGIFSTRLHLDSRVAPEAEVNSIGAAVGATVDGWGGRVKATHYPGGHATGAVGVQRSFEHVAAALNGTLGSDGRWSMLVSVGTSIGRDPYDDEWRLQPDSLLNSGSVVARLYEDRNHNGEMDRQDRPIEDVTFKAKHGADQPTTDEGVAVLRGIASHRYVDVEMQRDTLESPFALPAQEAITAVVRPGKVLRVDFPVVMAGEVEGTLYEATGDGRKPAAGIELELVNEAGEVVAESTTAFDGFYLFNLVPPGQYHVRIAPEQAEAAGLELSESPAVVVEGAGSITYVDDVHARVVSPAPAGESSPERMASSK